MLETRLTVPNPLGLHARAAAQLVRLASTFRSKIDLARVDNTVIANAKSILSVLTLAASFGTPILLRVEGSDEREALKAIEDLFLNGFGEI